MVDSALALVVLVAVSLEQPKLTAAAVELAAAMQLTFASVVPANVVYLQPSAVLQHAIELAVENVAGKEEKRKKNLNIDTKCHKSILIFIQTL